MSFPETVSDCYANSKFHQLSGWLGSDDPTGEEAGGGGLGGSAGVRPVGRTA